MKLTQMLSTAALAGIFAIFAATAQADVVHLQSGKQLRGVAEVSVENPEVIVFTSSSGQ